MFNTVLNYHAVSCGYESAVHVAYQRGLLLLIPVGIMASTQRSPVRLLAYQSSLIVRHSL
jgi:hypothetical protein